MRASSFLLLAARSASAATVTKEVVVLSTANFSETVGTKLWLIKFYAPVRSEAIHERARAQHYRPFANP